MVDVGANVAHVRQRIEAAARAAGRDPATITLVAVSKYHPASAVRAAIAAGCHDLGESYADEGVAKRAEVAEPAATWHFIGPLQSNKTRAVAEHFDFIHGVDRLKIARRLSEQRPAELGPLPVCLQVNISGEASKSGADPAEVPELAAAVAELPGLALRGLMAIPARAADVGEQRRPFAALRELQEDLQARGLALDTLSMGMSGDLEAAIAEGATHVRVGTDIFGPRE
ncbi:MAG: YggS family pyridoxal phosphate-dependent enzyme [Pseudomonadota bacterium]